MATEDEIVEIGNDIVAKLDNEGVLDLIEYLKTILEGDGYEVVFSAKKGD